MYTSCSNTTLINFLSYLIVVRRFSSKCPANTEPPPLVFKYTEKCGKGEGNFLVNVLIFVFYPRLFYSYEFNSNLKNTEDNFKKF